MRIYCVTSMHRFEGEHESKTEQRRSEGVYVLNCSKKQMDGNLDIPMGKEELFADTWQRTPKGQHELWQI